MENQTKQNTEKKSKTINKTALLVAGLVILTIVLLVVSLTSRSGVLRPGGSDKIKTGFADTSLAFSDTPRTGTISGVYEMDINIDSKNSKITGAQIELSYDPKKLTKVDIKPGNFLDNPVVIVKSIDTDSGVIKFWLGNRVEKEGVKGDGTIAVVTFSKPASGEAQINFLPKTSISAEGIDQSVLKETVSALIP